MNLPLGGELIARAPGWVFELGVYELLLLIGGAVILVGSVALSVQRGRPFSAAILYLTAGVLAGLILRGIGINWYDPLEDAQLFSRAAELAVIVSLFGAGVKLDRALTWRNWRTTVLLLAVAMPLTIAGMALIGLWLVGMALAGAILLGAVLAPTDPVLAEDVQVSGPMQKEPEDESRFSITAEAGLSVPTLQVDGGASANDLLCQLQADQLDIPVQRPQVLETTALGAAFLAGLGTGVWSSTAELADTWKLDRRFTPVAGARDDGRHARWRVAVDRSRNWAEDD